MKGSTNPLEPERTMSDEVLIDLIKGRISANKASILQEESQKQEVINKFKLVYIHSMSDTIISLESENFTAALYSWDRHNMVINMTCKLDVKDIKTFEEFQEARKIVTDEKQRIMTAVYWLSFRLFD